MGRDSFRKGEKRVGRCWNFVVFSDYGPREDPGNPPLSHECVSVRVYVRARVCSGSSPRGREGGSLRVYPSL